MLIHFWLFFFCPSRFSVLITHLYFTLPYLLPCTIKFSHHCSFIYRHIPMFPLLLLACWWLWPAMCSFSLLITGLHKQTSHNLLIFSFLGQDIALKNKESKRKKLFSKFMWNCARIWGDSGDTKNREKLQQRK